MWNDLLKSVFSGGSLSLGSVLLVLGLALVLGVIGAWSYIRKNRSNRSMAVTLSLLPLITAAVIMAVNGNLGAGIAVAGSFSLIRFRSAQGTGQEILAVFLAAAVGLCLGAGYAVLACLLMALYLLASAVLSALHFGQEADSERELRVTLPEALDYEGLFDDLLAAHCASYTLEQVRTVEMGTAFQLIYRVSMKGQTPPKAFLDALRERNGNLPVSLGLIPQRHQSL